MSQLTKLEHDADKRNKFRMKQKLTQPNKRNRDESSGSPLKKFMKMLDFRQDYIYGIRKKMQEHNQHKNLTEDKEISSTSSEEDPITPGAFLNNKKNQDYIDYT